MYLGQFYSVQIDMKHNLLSLSGGFFGLLHETQF